VISTVNYVETGTALAGRLREGERAKAIAALDDFLAVPSAEIAPLESATARAALSARLTFGKGFGTSGGLNFGAVSPIRWTAGNLILFKPREELYTVGQDAGFGSSRNALLESRQSKEYQREARERAARRSDSPTGQQFGQRANEDHWQCISRKRDADANELDEPIRTRCAHVGAENKAEPL
jgi:hypothetical protein